MNTIKKTITINTLILIVFFLIMNLNTSQHEAVHEAIYTNDGCKNTTITQNYLTMSGETTCTHGPEYDVSPQADLLNGYNEIVSYNNTSIIMCFLALIMIVSSLLIVLIDKGETN